MESAQREMRRAYVNGAPGVFVSGLVWVVAGIVWSRFGTATAFAVLFFGGMLIMPLAILIARTVFGTPKSASGHPLDRLALESTFFLFAALLVGYAMLRSSPQSVFPLLAALIGARYFVFRTIYGEWLYWLLAAVLVTIGASALLTNVAWSINPALAFGFVELLFAAALIRRCERVTTD